MNQAIVARNGEIEQAHNAEFANGENAGSLRDSFRRHLSGPELDLAFGLADNDMTRADAARLEIERRSFITSDSTVNGILESQYTRAQTEVRRDLEHDLANRRDLAAVRGEQWDERSQRAAMERRVDDLAQERSRGYMEALEQRFDSTYSRFGTGGLQLMIAFNVSGNDQDRARQLLSQGGRLTHEQEIQYAIDGVGTDLDHLKATLGRMSNEEIAALSPAMRRRILSEVSGRDRFDIEELLRGEPTTPQERLARARRQLNYESNSYALGNLFSGDQLGALQRDVARLEAEVDEYDELERRRQAAATAGEWTPEDQERADYLEWSTSQGTLEVDSAVSEHRRSVDHLADTAAMIGAIVAAVVVTIVLEVGTVGGATPGVAAAWAAFAAASTTIVTKAALKGQAYSEEELLVDVATGVVDVVAAVATAGMGNALLRVAKGVPAGRLATMAASSSMSKRMIARGVAEATEGFVSSLPSAVVGTMVDEKTWRSGDPATNLAMGIGMGAGMGTLMSGGLGALGGIAKPKGGVDVPRLGPDGIADPAAVARSLDEGVPPSVAPDPSVRAAQWDAHRARHPGAKYDDFLADLDAGRIRPEPDAPQRFAQRVGDELTAGLPPGQRAVVADVPVEVVSDADFRRLTRSSSGQAVTIIDHGRPRILLREGADLHVLREEGLHVAQLLDRRFERHARLLDEANLRRWDDLPLNTRIEMYRAKLDLEIDANRSLLRGLDEQLDAMPPGAARDAIADQAASARRNLRNLVDRSTELASFGPLDRFRARLGRGPLADRLAQPPRLFSKQKPKVTVDPGAAAATAVDDEAPGAPKAPDVDAPATAPTAHHAAPATPAPATPVPVGEPPNVGGNSGTVRPSDAALEAAKADPKQAHALDPGLHRSPQMDTDGAVVEQIGPEWVEGGRLPPRVEGDRYRLIRVTTEQDGITTVRYFQETVSRKTKTWRLRGSQSNRAGLIAEEASLALTQRRIRAGADIATAGGATQNASGHGFDEVYFRFDPDGPKIVVVEVKNYEGHHVPFEDFTAVTRGEAGDRLGNNLDELWKVVSGPKHRMPEGLRGLSPERLEAVRRAVADARRARRGNVHPVPGLELEVRLAPGTMIGRTPNGKGTPTLQRLETDFPGPVRVEGDVRSHPNRPPGIPEDLMRDAEKIVDAGVDVGEARTTVLDGYRRMVRDGVLTPPIRPAPAGGGQFVDAAGRHAVIAPVTMTSVGRRMPRRTAVLKRQAAELVELVTESSDSLHVYVDVSALDEASLQRLRWQIYRKLAAADRLDAMERITFTTHRPPRLRSASYGSATPVG